MRLRVICLLLPSVALSMSACAGDSGSKRSNTQGGTTATNSTAVGGDETGTSSTTSSGAGGTRSESTSVGGSSVGAAGSTGFLAGGPRWVGRVDATDANAVKFAWQGAGLVAIVKGTTIAVKLKTEGTPTVFFQPVIDGTVGTRFSVNTGSEQTVTLASNLADGEHRVELYRETEGMYGLSTFLGFTSGTVVGAPVSNGRLIEVVGDSISAGYGNLGSEVHPNWVADPACHWTAENSSWYATYAAVAGHALDAEVSTVAHSGWGMYRDLGGSTTGVLSSVYDRALGTNDATKWGFGPKASVVVVNLGTNDWAKGDPGEAYETAYVDFIGKLRGVYPDAWIFMTIGSMTGEPALTQVKTHFDKILATVKAATGDQRLIAFDLGTQNLGSDGSVPSGCDWHPNAADHKRMAGILQKQLSDRLGW
ncbi:MAG: GDSL-type esterase/lipase family protein [Polyangiaceae bacterium]